MKPKPFAVRAAPFAAFALAAAAHAQCRPSTPTSVRASDGSACAYVEVSWGASSGTVLWYDVLRSASSSGPWLRQTGTSQTRWTDVTTLGRPYYYRVVAVGPCGASDPSSSNRGYAGVEPEPPQGLTASYATECDGVTLRWEEVANAWTYEVWRSDQPDYQTATRWGVTTATYFLDATSARDREWHYWVTTSNVCGRSGPSGRAVGFPGESPAMPAEIIATRSYCDRVEVSWRNESGRGRVRPITFKVWRGDRQYVFEGSEEIASVVEESYGQFEFGRVSDTTAEPGRLYYYWVSAESVCGDTRNPYSRDGLRLEWPHSITSQPRNVSVAAGARAEFSVTVEGEPPLSYHWFKGEDRVLDGGNIWGAESARLVINPVTPQDAGEYRLSIRNSSPCYSSLLWSDPATLEVLACYADCDPSGAPGTLDVFDFLCFQNRYDANDPYACDCDTAGGPGVCDIFDFLCYQNAFDAGCP